MGDIKNIPGVKSVEVGKVENIQFFSIGELPGNYPVRVSGDFKKMKLVDLGKLDVKEELKGTVRFFSSTLTLKTESNWTASDLRRCVFKVQLISGETYLMGWKERPFPTTTIDSKVSNNATDPKINTLSISWKATIPPLLVAD